MRIPPLLLLALLLAASPAAAAEEAPPPPPPPAPAPPAPAPADRALPHHPGGIAWEKDLDAARAASREDGRPVALYFTFAT
ncbi:MAG: hypothetical protein L6R43_07795 [Planctomycetes bacterium]|nr:hypothetical protein [Planctomycetota bacterium]